MGCDLNILIKCFTCSDFNPRTHRGVRHDLKLYPGNNIIISIHAPIVGCDEDYLVLCRIPQISIHAPIVGCDGSSSFVSYSLTNFNPRTHRGVRQDIFCSFLMSKRFQSTHPSWGATIYLKDNPSLSSISIHAPIVGCDTSVLRLLLDGLNFNPRTHRGVRRFCQV